MGRKFSRTLLGIAAAFAAANTGCTSLLYHPTRDEHVDRRKLRVQPKDIEFAAEDGTRLHGWLFESPARSKARDCVFVHFHGNAQNLSTHFLMLYPALERGYDFFIFDYRGYGKSEGEPTPEGTVADGRAALKLVQRRFPERGLIVLGQSLGGAVAVKSVVDVKNDATIRLVILDSTFGSYRRVARSILAKNWFTWPLQPLAHLILSDEFAPEKAVGRVSPIPLLVIHGENDPMIDLSHGEALFSKAQEPKEFWRIPEGRHTDFFWRGNGEWADRFFARVAQACPNPTRR